ncbi:cytochrome c [Paenibacillus aurantius]|uniref:Cytochrome c n=1 Tax=Paenibacillus aurantius TaxID=2918900 RepID=A0AA96LBZ6_9BACL|nr:cytochrome c [Paenibacillus aurantius]WJH35209.1 cytochrome c [Paenibacillus sp. CC-CFT747]WNQ10485.1 cytochrome c [Paenibacillus aurantius]
MMSKSRWAGLSVSVLLALSLSACGGNKQGASPSPGGGAATPGGTTGGATVDAQAVYKANCVTCHGDNLEGRMGGNTNLTKVGGRKSKDQITAQITNGGNGMPAFGSKLKPDEISALADWLAAKK